MATAWQLRVLLRSDVGLLTRGRVLWRMSGSAEETRLGTMLGLRASCPTVRRLPYRSTEVRTGVRCACVCSVGLLWRVSAAGDGVVGRGPNAPVVGVGRGVGTCGRAARMPASFPRVGNAGKTRAGRLRR